MGIFHALLSSRWGNAVFDHLPANIWTVSDKFIWSFCNQYGKRGSGNVVLRTVPRKGSPKFARNCKVSAHVKSRTGSALAFEVFAELSNV